MTCEYCYTILAIKEVEEVKKTGKHECPYCDKPLTRVENHVILDV